MSKKNREGRKIRVKWRKLETNTWKLYHRKLSSGQFKRAKECEYKNTNKMGGKAGEIGKRGTLHESCV